MCVYMKKILLLFIILYSFSNNAKAEEYNSCKYVEKGLNTILTDYHPLMFRNVQKIYISVTSSIKEPDESPIFKQINLENLAVCTLKEHLSNNAQSKWPIQINIGDKTIPFTKWAYAKKDGNLVIWIDTKISKKRITGNNESKIYIFQVSYYRHDVTEPENIVHQCVDAFPYSPDADLISHFATNAMSKCLRKQYHFAKETPQGIIFGEK